MIAVSISVDTSRLNAALAYGRKWSSKSPAKMVNSTGLAILKPLIEHLTPYVPMSRIDEELGVSVLLQPKKRGKGYLTSSRTRKYTGGKMVTLRDGRTVPLAFMIIIARANLTRQGRATGTSRYNELTNNRWRIDKSELRNADIPARIHRMIASRHSSIKFLIAGWAVARNQLRGAPLVDPVMDSAGGEVLWNKHFGSATPAQEGAIMAICIIENLVGTDYSLNAANYNQALIQHGLGPLQQAVDDEAESKFLHYAEKEFNRSLLPRWDALVR